MMFWNPTPLQKRFLESKEELVLYGGGQPHRAIYIPWSLMMYPINDQEQAQIENSFTYHSPKPDQIPRYGKLRDMAKELAIEIHKSVPPGRYRSLAITALEDCIMRANKGIACGE